MRKKVHAKIKYDPERNLYLFEGKEHLLLPEEAGDQYGMHKISLREQKTGEEVLRFYPHEYGKEDEFHYIHIRGIDGKDGFEGKIVRPASITKMGSWYATRGQNAFLAVLYYLWKNAAKEILVQPANRKLEEYYKKYSLLPLQKGQVLNSSPNVTYMALSLENITEEYFAEREFLKGAGK